MLPCGKVEVPCKCFITLYPITSLIIYFSPERVRVVVENPPPSKFFAIPYGVPLDYFDELFFNTVLTVRERRKVYEMARYKIGLPSADLCTRANWHLWKDLKYDAFMTVYGNTELAKYQIPSKEDIALLDEYERRGEFDADFEIGEDDGDDVVEEQEVDGHLVDNNNNTAPNNDGTDYVMGGE